MRLLSELLHIEDAEGAELRVCAALRAVWEGKDGTDKRRGD